MPRSVMRTGRAWRRGRRWGTWSAVSAWSLFSVWCRWRARTRAHRIEEAGAAVPVAEIDAELLGLRRDLDARLVETLADAAGDGVLRRPGLAHRHHEAGGQLHPVVGRPHEDPGFDLGVRDRIATLHGTDRLPRPFRRRGPDGLLLDDALRLVPVTPVGDRHRQLLPHEVEHGAEVVDGLGEGRLVRDGDDAARVLPALNPGILVLGGADLEHLGAQQGDVDDVASHAAQLDSVADAEDVSRGDVEPAGDGADHLLHGEGDAGSGEAEDDPDVARQAPPDDGEGDHRTEHDGVAGQLAGVETGVGVLEPPSGEPSRQPQEDRHRHGDHGGGDQAGRGVTHEAVCTRFRCGPTVYRGSSADSKPALKMLQRVRATPTRVIAAPSRATPGRRRPPATTMAAPPARRVLAALAGRLAAPE